MLACRCFCDAEAVASVEEELNSPDMLAAILYQASLATTRGGCGIAVEFVNDDGTCTPFQVPAEPAAASALPPSA